MHRSFTYLNFVLLLALGGVCVFQWRQERVYGDRIAALQKQSDQQQNKIQVQTEDLRRTNEDVEGFKQTVASLTTQTESQAATLRDQKAQVFVLESEKEKLTKQLDAWKQALDEHKTALENRDQNIKTLLEQREQLVAAQNDTATKANQAITAYNELARKYEDVVGRYNQLAAQFQAERDAAAAALAAGTTPTK